MSLFNQFTNINILLERNFPYQQEGRYQDEDGAVKVHNDIYKLLDELDIKYTKGHSPEIAASADQYSRFVDNIANNIMVYLQRIHK